VRFQSLEGIVYENLLRYLPIVKLHQQTRVRRITMTENKIFRLGLAALMLLAASLACSLTIITVDCSVADLIDAINQANAITAPSTLELDPGCTYPLTAVDNTTTSANGGSTFDYGDNGLPQITTPITINGNNATITRSSGAPEFRIFFIKDTGSLTINDLTLSNGLANRPGDTFPSSGGAIYNDGAYLEINHSNLLSNEATFHGGAIFTISNATTYVNDSTVHENTALLGGGIFIYHGGLLSIDNGEVTNNIAINGGGGISAPYGAELIVNDSLIASNHAGGHGGGIFKDRGSVRLPTTITGTTFQNNTANWSGGGVFILRTPLTISDSQFSNNHADEYGGGLGYQNNSTETVLISNTTFDANSAAWDGGAIHFSGESMSINNSTIQNNMAANGAGIHNGTADDPFTKYIIRTDTTLIITGSILQENIASGDGGGAFNEGVMTCGESTFVNNESYTLGGGIHNTGEIEILGCTFDKNRSGSDGGGINNHNIAEIRDSTFTNNASVRGGGVATSMGDTQIYDSTLSDNEASSEGGGIFNDGSMKVFQSTLSANEASTLGGGIYNIEEINVQKCTFEDNTASRGGGLAAAGGDTALINNTFSTNTATDSGGGLFNMGPSNEDTTPGGEMQASHITVAYNSAPTGGGIATSGGSLSIKNSIVALSPSGSDCHASAAGFSALGENIDTDGSCIGFTLKADPLLAPLANNGGPTQTHALKAGSPAIDAAPVCATVGGAAVSDDQRGVGRPQGAACDLGAYEEDQLTFLPYSCIRVRGITMLDGGGMRIQIETSNLPDGTYDATVNTDPFSCNTYTEYPDRLFCDGPRGDANTMATLTVFGQDGEEICIETIDIPPEDKEKPKRPQPEYQGCLWTGNLTTAPKCVVPCPNDAFSGAGCIP
jgi:hypothetical protein